MECVYYYDNKRYPETIIKSIKMKQSALAEKVGAKSESVISSRMTTKNMGVNMLVEMLDCMGYELKYLDVIFDDDWAVLSISLIIKKPGATAW